MKSRNLKSIAFNKHQFEGLRFCNKHQRGKIYIAVIHYTIDEATNDIIRSSDKVKYFTNSKTICKEKTEMAI